MMKKRNSRYNSDTAEQRRRQSIVEQDDDISLLQRPLRTAFTGFQEAKRAYEDGTSEVRRLLLQECSLIYECNVCRNMFRSLANFISHKRVFCVSPAATGYYNGFTDHNSSAVIIQQTAAHTPDIEAMKRSRSTGSSPVPVDTQAGASVRGSMRDLSRVIERLRREKASQTTNADTTQPEKHDNKTTILQLESVPTSKQAVYQTLKQQDSDSIKTEVQEVDQLLNNAMNTVLGPDGVAITSTAAPSGKTTKEQPSKRANKFGCDKCNSEYQTLKTLKLHIQKKHSLTSYVFQCPACSLTFIQAAAVIRHLSKDHKKPTRRIRLMRDTILRRRIQQSDVQVRGQNRELKRLQMSDVPAEQSIAYGNEQRKVMSTCIYCEKSFERRAALSTHLLNCRAKQRALKNPAPPVKRLGCPRRSKVESFTKKSIKSELPEKSKDVDCKKIVEHEVEAPNRRLSSLGDNQSQEQSVGSELQALYTQSESDSDVSTKAEVSNDETDTKDETSILSDFEDSKLEDTNEHEASKATKDGGGSNSSCSSSQKKKQPRNTPIEKMVKCRCKICNKNFNALSNVRRHISMFHYRARRFGCKLCEYRAFRRYDIVNHLGFVHKMHGDREELASQYVSTYECEYTKEDIDGDILIFELEESKAIADVPPAVSAETVDADNDEKTPLTRPRIVKTYEKRNKRKKDTEESQAEDARTHIAKVEQTATIQSDVKKKLRRSRSQHTNDESSTQDGEKRPTRKRVKAENKDFVYDLSRLLKNDANGNAQVGNGETQAIVSQRPKRRPNSGAGTMESTMPATSSAAHDVHEQRITRAAAKPLGPPMITESNKQSVHGTVRRIMLYLVSQGLAVSATLPELPAERPLMRPRLISTVRNDSEQADCVTATLIDTVKLEVDSVLLRPRLKDSFIEKIAQRTAAAAASKTAVTPILETANNNNNKISISIPLTAPPPAPPPPPLQVKQKLKLPHFEPPVATCASPEYNAAPVQPTLDAMSQQPSMQQLMPVAYSEPLYQANMYSAIPGHVYTTTHPNYCITPPQKFTTPTPSSPPYPPPPRRPHYNYIAATAADPVPSLTLTMDSLLRSALQN